MAKPKNDRIGELIRVLSMDLTPKGHLNFTIQFLSWSGLLVLGILLGYTISIIIHRPSFPGWWPEPILILVWGILSAFCLSKSAYPEENSIWYICGAAIAIFLWIGYDSIRFAADFHLAHIHIGFCPVGLVLSSFIIGAFGWIFLGKMASSRPGLSAFLFLSFLLAASNLTLKFTCPDQSAQHIFFSHVIGSLVWILLFWFPVRKKFSW